MKFTASNQRAKTSKKVEIHPRSRAYEYSGDGTNKEEEFDVDSFAMDARGTAEGHSTAGRGTAEGHITPSKSRKESRKESIQYCNGRKLGVESPRSYIA